MERQILNVSAGNAKQSRAGSCSPSSLRALPPRTGLCLSGHCRDRDSMGEPGADLCSNTTNQAFRGLSSLIPSAPLFPTEPWGEQAKPSLCAHGGFVTLNTQYPAIPQAKPSCGIPSMTPSCPVRAVPSHPQHLQAVRQNLQLLVRNCPNPSVGQQWVSQRQGGTGRVTAAPRSPGSAQKGAQPSRGAVEIGDAALGMRGCKEDTYSSLRPE